jgi:hypothetical protein
MRGPDQQRILPNRELPGVPDNLANVDPNSGPACSNMRRNGLRQTVGI